MIPTYWFTYERTSDEVVRRLLVKMVVDDWAEQMRTWERRMSGARMPQRPLFATGGILKDTGEKMAVRTGSVATPGQWAEMAPEERKGVKMIRTTMVFREYVD